LPLPDSPLAMLTQLNELEATHAQPAVVVTPIVADPPAAPTHTTAGFTA
jgi:2-methylisocitrate lyase-like PEP mutase family enzyme